MDIIADVIIIIMERGRVFERRCTPPNLAHNVLHTRAIQNICGATEQTFV